jgi:dienelactone hydrolase
VSLIRMGPTGKVRRRPAPSVPPQDPYPTTGDWIFGTATGSAGSVMPYAFFIPVGAAPDAAMKQLVVWIGGVDAKDANNIALVLASELPTVISANKATFPHYCLAMQIPDIDGLAGGAGWEYRQALGALIAELTAQYPIDPSRRHITGFSTGGIYSWDMPSSFPLLFASVTPVGGGIRAGHYGLVANGAVASPIATDQGCYDDFATRHPTLAICAVIGENDSFYYADYTAMIARWNATGYAFTSVNNDVGMLTTDLRVYSTWTGPTSGHGGAMNASHFALGNTSYWNWLAAQVRAV